MSEREHVSQYLNQSFSLKKGLDGQEEVSVKKEQKERESLLIITSEEEGVPGKVDRWFNGFCEQHGLDPKNSLINKIGYHVIELAKNAADYGGGGEVHVQLGEAQFTVVIQDHGQGFENVLEDIETSAGGGYGLKEAMRFADEFLIETHGERFEKVLQGKRRKFIKTNPSLIVTGSKITFIKKFIKR
jgi:anti-sigma regulatory factor (Ser/Thr protein kinase)